MGRVYRAAHPRLDQDVALKVLQPGLESGPIVARFEGERQTLARMDHPSIARVIDGGMTDDGRPFFAMELVRGLPITSYCYEHQLTVRRRLELFITICQAVQHAHQKGIIHRDLKPSNILVAEYDGKPVPKVIDFGIARATERQATLQTQAGMVVGTPDYMSPEQADPASQDIDTRSDIYALGVVLYELLTGATPFAQRAANVPIFEVLRMIREVDPPPPSIRLGKSDQNEVRGELDWITLKCLEKDRARRYDTAAALAEDVRRFLDDEPVAAGPPSKTYRLRKFVRRNRGKVLAATIVLLTLVGGIVGTTMNAVRANRERDNKDAALKGETLALKEAMEALRSLTDDVVERQLGRQVTLTKDDRAFFNKVIAKYEKLATIRDEGEDSQAMRAEGYARVASLRQHLGENAEALPSFERARDMFGQLAVDFPSNLAHRHEHGRTIVRIAHVHGILGKNVEAEAEYKQAVTILSELTQMAPDVPDYQRELAGAHVGLAEHYSKVSDYAAGELEIQRALALIEQLVGRYPDSADYRSRLSRYRSSYGLMLVERGKRDAGIREFLIVRDLDKQLAADYPESPDYREQLAISNNRLGNAWQVAGKHDDADKIFVDSTAILRQLSAEFPTVPRYRRYLATTQTNRGALLRRLTRPADAALEFRDALALQKRLADDFPQDTTYRKQLVTGHLNLAAALNEAGNDPEAESHYREAINVGIQVVADQPEVAEYRKALSMAHNNLGALLSGTGRRDLALAEYGRALELRTKLVADFPGVPEFRGLLGGTHMNRANLFHNAAQFVAAESEYRQAQDLKKQLSLDFPNVPAYRQELANTHTGLANALAKQKRFADADAEHQQAIELYTQLAAKFPKVPENAISLARSYQNYANLIRDRGEPERALEWSDRAMQTATKAVGAQAKLPSAPRLFRQVHVGKALALMKLERFPDAIQNWDRALEYSDATNRDETRMERAICFARTEPDRAIAEAEELIGGDKTRPATIYKAAAVYALASAHPEKSSERETYAVRAMVMLDAAREKGHFKGPAQIEELQQDADFKALVERDDFKKWLAGLEESPNP